MGEHIRSDHSPTKAQVIYDVSTDEQTIAYASVCGKILVGAATWHIRVVLRSPECDSLMQKILVNLLISIFHRVCTFLLPPISNTAVSLSLLHPCIYQLVTSTWWVCCVGRGHEETLYIGKSYHVVLSQCRPLIIKYLLHYFVASTLLWLSTLLVI